MLIAGTAINSPPYYVYFYEFTRPVEIISEMDLFFFSYIYLFKVFYSAFLFSFLFSFDDLARDRDKKKSYHFKQTNKQNTVG